MKKTVKFNGKDIEVKFNEEGTKLIKCELTELYENYDINHSEFCALVDEALSSDSLPPQTEEVQMNKLVNAPRTKTISTKVNGHPVTIKVTHSPFHNYPRNGVCVVSWRKSFEIHAEGECTSDWRTSKASTRSVLEQMTRWVGDREQVYLARAKFEASLKN